MLGPVLLAFAGIALATFPSPKGFTDPSFTVSKGGNAHCVQGYVPVTASTTENIAFDFIAPNNQIGATQVFLADDTSGSPFADQIELGYSNISGTYQIYAVLCEPISTLQGMSPKGVQFLTHGVGFGRDYWDFQSNYSYVDIAAQHGYATFAYDRLGVDLSATPDPVQVIQAPLEVSIANVLANKVRAGEFSNSTFSTVVGVGHSFGSLITQAITADYPSTFDAVILTGFSGNSTALATFTQGLNLAIANQINHPEWGYLNDGFLVSSTVISSQIGFFRAPGFDPKILAANEAAKRTVTYGELFTQSDISAVASNYTKPVAVVNGAEDLPFCYGNCSYPINKAQAVLTSLYPALSSSKFSAYLAPTTGHALNLHYTANASFQWIQNFLKDQGLGL